MKRYHKEVKFNENLIKHLAPYKMKLTTTPHFINRTKRKKIPYPSKKLLKKGEIFESEGEKFLKNANGPGNTWENNGPMVNDSIKANAGLTKEYSYLKEK